jgi:hypothetical protein
MKRTYVIASLATVGLAFVGPLTRDAVDFARAVDSQNSEALIAFSNQNPTSFWAADALQIASNQTDNGTNTNNGNGFGGGDGGGAGNQGNDKDVGNSYAGG